MYSFAYQNRVLCYDLVNSDDYVTIVAFEKQVKRSLAVILVCQKADGTYDYHSQIVGSAT
jgi:hypothetical protein